MPELKDFLKDLRAKHGTQEEVGEKIGYKSQQISQYETGTRHPKLKFFKKWKEAFGEDLVAMMGEANVSHETKNHTLVDKSSDNTEKPLSEEVGRIYQQLYEKFLGENSQYLIIHKEVLSNHRLVALEQVKQQSKHTDDLLDMNNRLVARVLNLETKAQGVKKRKDNP